VLGIPVYENFFGVGAGNSDYAGPSGPYEGGHAIAVFGYDSYGVTIENSWSASWGNNGFARLSWSFIDNYAYEGYSIDGLDSGPDITSMTPKIGSTAGGATVTVNGVGFAAETTVAFDGVPGTNVAVNDAGTQLTVTAPAHASGLANVTVTTTDGTSANGTQAQYRYEGAPTVSAVSPRAGSTLGGTTMKVTGTNLFGGVVRIGGVAGTASVNATGTLLTVRTHAKAAGAAVITVTTPVGVTTAGEYTYVAPPAVSTVSTRLGSYRGGTRVTITGARFAGAKVTIGGKVAQLLWLSTTKILISTPGGTAGAHGAIVVTTVGGATTSGIFTWVH
jgi:hypothetical protein